MQTPLALFRFVAKAALNAVGFGVAGDFAVEVLPQMARDVWSSWGKDRSEAERKADVQALVQAPADEVKEQAKAVVREVAGDQPTAVQAQLETYLNQVPTVARQSLRRRDDPRGVTVPPSRGLQKPEDLLPFLPTRLPRFRSGDSPLPVNWVLVELLGVGGFGEVWKAENPQFRGLGTVALKFCLDPAAKERLLQHEANVLNQIMMAQAGETGIVRLRQVYLKADPPCLEYDFVEGGDLAGLLFRQLQRNPTGLDAETVQRIVLRLARTMAFAHGLKPPVVHRDLKPANILCQRTSDGVKLRITDFGIGGVVADQAIEGTRGAQSSYLQVTAVRGAYSPLYASPQQMEGAPPDPRDDVYALGVIWYQLLTGDLSHGPSTDWREDLLERNVDGGTVDLLARCITGRTERRFADAGELARGLEGLAKIRQPGPAAPTTTGKKPVGKDRFGNRLGSQAAAINAALGPEPKSADAVAKETGLGVPRVKSHFAWLAARGFGAQSEKGFYLTAEKAPPAGTDRFGRRIGSQVSRMNAVLGATPKSAQEIADEVGAKLSSVHSHLRTLMSEGFVVKTEDGRYKVADTLPPKATTASRRDKILAVLTTTPMMPKEIREATGLAPPINGVLKGLIDEGLVVRTGAGYALVRGVGPEAASPPAAGEGTKEGSPSTQGVRPFGHSVTRILHWMGLRNWTPDEARAVLRGFGVEDVNESTLRTGLTDGRNPKYSRPAELTEEQAAQLQRMREASQARLEQEADEHIRERFSLDVPSVTLSPEAKALLRSSSPNHSDEAPPEMNQGSGEREGGSGDAPLTHS